MQPPVEHAFFGTHIFGELFGIEMKLLNNAELLEATLRDGIEQSGATLSGLQVKSFEPSGVTLLALLAESHTSIHTYPEFGSLFFDAFTCGDECQPQKIARVLVETLKPDSHRLHSLMRGNLPDSSGAWKNYLHKDIPTIRRLTI
jgi:S-adenosylmethionine decarboxylase proenzyme